MGLEFKKASLDLRDLRGVPMARRSCQYQADESSDPVWETIRSVRLLTLDRNFSVLIKPRMQDIYYLTIPSKL